MAFKILKNIALFILALTLTSFVISMES